ncbi:hypothetical protein KKD52_13330 [Myxococcota bacterium]|nr:hypothetical protein [Myxococcota bacterium]MBU1412200.1 hypothetical protein [Myxococcota bacterium]MBU1511336.1 hypothetical protein [Myxococcota bacterium]
MTRRPHKRHSGPGNPDSRPRQPQPAGQGTPGAPSGPASDAGSAARSRRRQGGENPSARRDRPAVELVQYGHDEGPETFTAENFTGYDVPAGWTEPDPFGDDLFTDLAPGFKPDAAASYLYAVHVRWGVPPKISEFHSETGPLQPGDEVLCETEKGQFFGEVTSGTRLITRGRNEHPRRVLQLASPEDRGQFEAHRKIAQEAFSFAATRIRQLNLDMKLFYVFVLSGGDKMMFYFTSETRVDFRRLVRDLAARFSMRIEMRQMGPRDDSRITGGLGICGKELCCASHLSKFLPVSIRMAKDQNLVLNPQSVSGQCNRLKCCLAYEQEFYQELRQGMPKLGKKIDTPHGIGRVLDINLLTGQIRILLDDGPMEMFTREQILAMRQEQAAAEPSPEPEAEPEPEPEPS